MLVPTFTVTENVLLGLGQHGHLRLDLASARKKISELADEFHLDVDPDAPIESLSVGEQQRVEIMKLLFRDVQVLILDEPTAVLTPREADALFRICSALRARGKAIVLITHKLREVFAIADRVTVLRRGHVVATTPASSTDARTLAELMVGKEWADELGTSTTVTQAAGKVALEAEHLRVTDELDRVRVDDVSFAVAAGEILGIAGVDGNGQAELAHALLGLAPSISGTVRLGSDEITKRSPRARRTAGLAYVPADRRGEGSVAEFMIPENAILGYQSVYRRHRFFVDRARAQTAASTIATDTDMRIGDLDRAARTLSGGTLQKLIIGRELLSRPIVLVAEHPTRGLDIAGTRYVRDQLRLARNEGMAVLLISADLDEILGLSDRVMVMNSGRVMGIGGVKDFSMAELGQMMAGTPLGGASS
jgi:simple sugar transport system ATP-binding protein